MVTLKRPEWASQIKGGGVQSVCNDVQIQQSGMPSALIL